MLNTLPVESQGRTPRSIVKINDIVVDAWESWDVNNNTFYQADTFELTLSTSDLPSNMDADWFSRQDEIKVEILAALPADPNNVLASEYESLIVGNVDPNDYNPTHGTITLSGRDFTARLIDHTTSDRFLTRTASQIATTLATRRGLTPVVTATKTKAGHYYEIDHVITDTGTRTEWDLITWLAQKEGFNVYVSGLELHFEPMPDESGNPYVITPTSVDEIGFSRNLHIAKGIVVKVHSWNDKQQKGFTKQYPTKGKGSDPQVFAVTIPNLSSDEATLKAQALYAQYAKHEMKMHATLDADHILKRTSVIEVRETHTAYDQVYFPESITRSMSFSGGYVMSITAKNHNTQSEVSL